MHRDVLQVVAGFTPVKDIARLGQTCKQYYYICKEIIKNKFNNPSAWENPDEVCKYRRCNVLQLVMWLRKRGEYNTLNRVMNYYEEHDENLAFRLATTRNPSWVPGNPKRVLNLCERLYLSTNSTRYPISLFTAYSADEIDELTYGKDVEWVYNGESLIDVGIRKLYHNKLITVTGDIIPLPHYTSTIKHHKNLTLFWVVIIIVFTISIIINFI